MPIIDEVSNDEWGALNALGYFPARATNTWAAGIDLGKAIDPSTVAILRKCRRPIEVLAGDPNHALDKNLRQQLGPAKIFVEFGGRIPLKTDYVEQARRLKALSEMGPYKTHCKDWVADASGVGKAMVDILETVGLHTTRVTITSSGGEAKGDGTYTVSKTDLMAALMASFAQREIKLSPKLPDYVEIMKQLRAMQASFTVAGAMTFNGASGTHDDFCTAIALALWKLNPVITGSRWQGSDLRSLIS
jgi:hypothetical protein